MIKTRALCSAAILGLVATLFAGCGDGDFSRTEICNPSEAVCLEGNSGRVCSEDGTEFVTFTCAQGQVCTDGACAGQCTGGEQTCASSAVSQVCSNQGDQWIPVVCPTGTACEEGDGCVPTDEGVQICEPEESTCANETTLKTCDADGTAWFYSQCSVGQTCDDGACAYPDGTICTPRETQCAGAGTSLRCNDDGDAWEVQECPANAPCSDGVCQGTGCVIGATKCDEPTPASALNGLSSGTGVVDFKILFTCVDGVNWEATQCAANTICTYDNITSAEVDEYTKDLLAWYEGQGIFSEFPVMDTSDSVASCQEPECPFPHDLAPYTDFYGGTNIYFGDTFVSDVLDINGVTGMSAACGDATDPEADPTKFYSVCAGLPPFRNLEWEVTSCPDPTTCSVKFDTAQTGVEVASPTCSSTCVPDEVQCASIESTHTCNDNGEWNAPEPCGAIEYEDEDAYEGACIANVTAAGTATGTCGDPICAYWAFYGGPSFGEVLGACTPNGDFRPCQDGVLGDPVPCASCQLDVNAGFMESTFGNAAGQLPGTCGGDECVDGSVRCFQGEPNNLTGLRQTCEDGQWLPTLDTECADDGLGCVATTGDDGLPAAECGECIDGETTCVGEQILTCENNTWPETAEDCAYGICNQDSGTAHCEALCLEGELRCPGGDGTAAVEECQGGIFVAQDDCAAGESCRLDRFDKAQGCVQCLGPDTAGNSLGVVDSYCDANGLVTCGADNEWPALGSGSCPDDLTCSAPGLVEHPTTSTFAYCTANVVVEAVAD